MTSPAPHPHQANRAKIVAANPEATFGEVGKLVGAAWKECSDKDKKPYAAQAEKDKARAAKDKAAAEKKA